MSQMWCCICGATKSGAFRLVGNLKICADCFNLTGDQDTRVKRELRAEEEASSGRLYCDRCNRFRPGTFHVIARTGQLVCGDCYLKPDRVGAKRALPPPRPTPSAGFGRGFQFED